MRPLSLVFAALLSQANKFKLVPLLAQPPRRLAAACGFLVALTPLPTHAQSCVPPPPGMVAWWPLEETGGTTVSDHSSLGLNPGTTNGPIGPPGGPPKSATGFVGKGMNFYFQNRVTVNHSGRLGFGTDKSFTIDAWIKGHAGPIVSNFDTGTKFGYSLFNDGSKVRLDMGPSIPQLQWYGPAVAPNAWTFVAVVVDRTSTSKTVTLYTAPASPANSGLATSGPLAIPASAHAGNDGPLYIGGCPGNPNGCDMIIDELEIFNRALTQPELQKIVNAGKAGKCKIPQKKGMTWIHSKSDATTGTITVGCNGCDGYHGDTPCTELRPLLCIYKPTTPFQLPTGLNNSDFYNRWSGGVVATTEPVAGNKFKDIKEANSYCSEKFGKGWRAAEFHDGVYWNFQAYGGTVSAPKVPSTRFWVYINDQKDGNCWP